MTQLSDYDYNLPAELIAQYPMRNRADSRLMVVYRETGTIEHLHVRDLPSLLYANDCLVLNNTKVLQARLCGKRTKTGGRWEGLFIEHDEHRLWKVMANTRGTPTVGETIDLETSEGRVGFKLELVAKMDDGYWVVKPLIDDDEDTWLALERVGWTPIPPYIRGGRMLPSDRENYQTVFASKPGAIAAPTAGLHFTPQLLQQIREQGVTLCPVTLHVGVGTFKPISVKQIEDHVMHTERAVLTEKSVGTIQRCKQTGGRTIAVGTTSVRVLESAIADDGQLQPFDGTTNLFIRPPYNFQAVDALMTNFHFPKSTLLIMVRQFGGDELIRAAYEEAIREQYRFFSFGDAMLIV
jgi:S-adenosylmethionine:tRNA ribosyltransferase-isomerase